VTFLWRSGSTLSTRSGSNVLGSSVAAFNLSDGTQLWEGDDLLGPLVGPISEPVCVDGIVVTGRESVILGLDAATGEKL